jgi:hypothetical protein
MCVRNPQAHPLPIFYFQMYTFCGQKPGVEGPGTKIRDGAVLSPGSVIVGSCNYRFIALSAIHQCRTRTTWLAGDTEASGVGTWNKSYFPRLTWDQYEFGS